MGRSKIEDFPFYIKGPAKFYDKVTLKQKT